MKNNEGIGIRFRDRIPLSTLSAKEGGTVGGNCVSPRRKAQAALEYMMVVGMVLIILAPIIYYSYQQNEIAIRASQAKLAASRISSAADSIYAQGPGAKTFLDILLPAGYSPQSFVSGNIINIRVYTAAGLGDFVETTRANMSGFLPGDSGYRRIYLMMLDSGHVNITE